MNLTCIKKSYPNCRILGITQFCNGSQWVDVETNDIALIDQLVYNPNVSYIQFKIQAESNQIHYADFGTDELRKEKEMVCNGN